MSTAHWFMRLIMFSYYVSLKKPSHSEGFLHKHKHGQMVTKRYEQSTIHRFESPVTGKEERSKTIHKLKRVQLTPSLPGL